MMSAKHQPQGHLGTPAQLPPQASGSQAWAQVSALQLRVTSLRGHSVWLITPTPHSLEPQVPGRAAHFARIIIKVAVVQKLSQILGQVFYTHYLSLQKQKQKGIIARFTSK